MSVMDSVKYSIEKLTNLSNQTFSILKDIEIDLEGSFLFNIKRPTNINTKFFTKKAHYTMQEFLLKEFNKIQIAKEPHSDELRESLSLYGSFYYGGNVIYYDERLDAYSDEQVFQIICNHIFHYILGYNVNNVRIDTQISNILLCFSHSNLTDIPIQYAQSKRDQLHLQPRYKDDLEKLIIFNTSQNYQKLFLNQIIENEYIEIYNHPQKGDLVVGTYLFPTQGNCNFLIYNFGLRNNGNIQKSGEDYLTSDLTVKKLNKILDSKINAKYSKFSRMMKEVRNNYEKIRTSNIIW